jgi:hypothetical protein
MGKINDMFQRYAELVPQVIFQASAYPRGEQDRVIRGQAVRQGGRGQAVHPGDGARRSTGKSDKATAFQTREILPPSMGGFQRANMSFNSGLSTTGGWMHVVACGSLRVVGCHRFNTQFWNGQSWRS